MKKIKKDLSPPHSSSPGKVKKAINKYLQEHTTPPPPPYFFSKKEKLPPNWKAIRIGSAVLLGVSSSQFVNRTLAESDPFWILLFGCFSIIAASVLAYSIGR